MSAGGRSRGAALALLAGVVVIIGAAAVVPAGLYWSKTGEAIRDARTKIQRSEQRKQAEDTLVRSQRDWTRFAATPSSGFILNSDDEAAIAATRQRIDSVFSELEGVAVSVAGEAGDGPREGVRSITIAVQGNLPRKNLGAFLTRLESEPAYIVISDFEAITSQNDQLLINLTGQVFRLLESGA